MIRFMRKSRTVLSMALVMGLVPIVWADLNDGLVAHYPFDGNANDASGNGNDGTVNGATLTADRFGNSNSAYNFDGVDDCILAEDNNTLDIQNDISLTAWIKTDSLHSNVGVIISKHYTNWSRSYLLVDTGGSYGRSEGLALQLIDVNNTIYETTPKVIDGSNWHLVTGIFDKLAEKMMFYIDGTLVTSSQAGQLDLMQTSVPLSIGCTLNNNNGSVLRELFNGIIDDIRIYNRALSECEVKSLYTGKDECQTNLDANWIELSPIGGPPAPRGSGTTAVRDPATNRMIVFAGSQNSGTRLNDTWILTHANGLGDTPQWTQLNTVNSPPIRSGHTAVYDSNNNRMIIFGGCHGKCQPTLNDVWVLSHANGLGGTPTWTQLFPTGTLPAGRNAPAAIYDSATNRMVMFAGQNGSGNSHATFAEVWVLTNANGLGGTPAWIKLAPNGSPPLGLYGYGPSGVYDPVNNKMIVFGYDVSNPLWVLSNANGLGGTPTWTNLIAEGVILPPELMSHSAVYNIANNQMIIYGSYNDVWVLNNANGITGTPTWIKRNSIGTIPKRRFGHGAVYDHVTERMTIFGGTAYFGGIIYDGSAWNVSNDTWVLTNDGQTTSCKLYGVHDEGLNNSQFLTISPETFEVNTLGEKCPKCDIEALDIHPQTGELFAASGNDTNKPAHLYHVDKNNGQLTDIGFTGMKEIDGLSFHPDGTLWGWSTGDGLVTIDTSTGQANLEIPHKAHEVEDLTWNKAGTILYGVENLVDSSPDISTRLLAYDGTKLTTVCKELTQSLGIEIEALDTLPDDTLIFGLHNKNSLPLGVIDVVNCQIIAEKEIPTGYDDVEGIAWPENCTE